MNECKLETVIEAARAFVHTVIWPSARVQS